MAYIVCTVALSRENTTTAAATAAVTTTTTTEVIISVNYCCDKDKLRQKLTYTKCKYLLGLMNSMMTLSLQRLLT